MIECRQHLGLSRSPWVTVHSAVRLEEIARGKRTMVVVTSSALLPSSLSIDWVGCPCL